MVNVVSDIWGGVAIMLVSALTIDALLIGVLVDMQIIVMTPTAIALEFNPLASCGVDVLSNVVVGVLIGVLADVLAGVILGVVASVSVAVLPDANLIVLAVGIASFELDIPARLEESILFCLALLRSCSMGVLDCDRALQA